MIKKRIIRNLSSELVETNYRGKIYKILPKKSISLEDGGVDEHAADYLLQTFGFLVEKTPKIKYKIGEVKIAKSK